MCWSHRQLGCLSTWRRYGQWMCCPPTRHQIRSAMRISGSRPATADLIASVGTYRSPVMARAARARCQPRGRVLRLTFRYDPAAWRVRSGEHRGHISRECRGQCQFGADAAASVWAVRSRQEKSEQAGSTRALTAARRRWRASAGDTGFCFAFVGFGRPSRAAARSRAGPRSVSVLIVAGPGAGARRARPQPAAYAGAACAVARGPAPGYPAAVWVFRVRGRFS